MVAKKIWIMLAIAVLLLIGSLFLSISERTLVNEKKAVSENYNEFIQGNPQGSINLVIIPNQNTNEK